MRKTLLQDAIGNSRQPAAILLFLLFLTTGYAIVADAQEEDFSAWVAAFHQDALAEGISSETLDAVLPGLTFRGPCRRARSQTARGDPDIHRVPVAGAAASTREPRQAIFAEASGLADRNRRRVWGSAALYRRAVGIESDFGRVTGGFLVLDALATLGVRRSARRVLSRAVA